MQQLSSEAIAGALRTSRLGRPVHYFERATSTNDLAHDFAAAGAPEGLLVVADEQTAGRGRLGRPWWAPKGTSLLMSLVLRPPIPPGRAGQLTMCLGLGAAEGIEAVTGLRPALKWPNDLILNGRKLGGILSELRTDGERLDNVVMGLGLNVNVEWSPQAPGSRGIRGPTVARDLRTAVPPDIASTATSLSAELSYPIDRLSLLAEIVYGCETWYERLLAAEAGMQADEPIHVAWAARLETLGRQVTITVLSGAVRGKAIGVTPEGALLVAREDGDVEVVWNGDVV